MTDSNHKKPQISFIRELSLEWTCALAASFSVAPIISIVDRAIIENASGKTRLWTGIKLGFYSIVNSPLKFSRKPAFLLIWGVYAGTYITGNSIDMICKRYEKSPTIPKFIGSSFANVTLSVGKDKIYTQMFGMAQQEAKKFPRFSYALFAARDSSTIFSGFTLPPIISAQIQKEFGLRKDIADWSSQLVVPCLMQFASCPLHLLGIDLYNRGNVSSIERLNLIKREYFPTVLGRIARIFPAYGIGGVLNRNLRKYFINS